jgi:hypothetical protein
VGQPIFLCFPRDWKDIRLIEFEHTLFMLLLLVGLFSAIPFNGKGTLLLIFGGVLLAMLPPFLHVELPWDLILVAVLPLLFWQNARFWLHTRWRLSAGELLLWIGTVLSLSLLLLLARYPDLPATLFLAVISASILWRAFEAQKPYSYVSQIGPLTLVFLLTEVAPAVETPNRYLGGLFSGAAAGIIVALIAIAISRRLLPAWRGRVALFQVYLAYLLADFLQASAIVAALISITVFSEGSLRRGLISGEVGLPAPLNHWPIFIAALFLFAILGWQAHQPLTAGLVFEAGTGLVVGSIAAWVGKQLHIAGLQDTAKNFRAVLRVGLFLFAALILWPRSTLSQPVILVVALGIAIIANVLSLSLISATKSL